MSGAGSPGGARPRAADDYTAIRERMTALRGNCICHVHRDDNGQLLSAWTNPACPLHGAAMSPEAWSLDPHAGR